MKSYFILFVAFTLFACQPVNKPKVEVLLEVDKQFSEAAEEMGYDRAFIEFAHPDAVLLRNNSMPIVGKSAIQRIFGNDTPENVHFSWKPMDGEIALSGELGYTYGIYTFQNDSIVEKGTYVSIWKKDKNGKWKYILDTGNEGIEE